jgi:four helix bundle protein
VRFFEKSCGLALALMGRMAGAKRFTELAAWKRARELQILCLDLLKDDRVQRDFKFRDQLADAASSGPRNIAEGFGRYRPRENARYVRVAKGSANELQSLFYEAQDKGFIKPEDFPRYDTAANRAIGTIVGYLKYLDRCDPGGPSGNSAGAAEEAETHLGTPEPRHLGTSEGTNVR